MGWVVGRSQQEVCEKCGLEPVLADFTRQNKFYGVRVHCERKKEFVDGQK